MKNLSIALILLLTVASTAHAQSVGSANIIGYTKKNVPPSGYYVLVGSSFNPSNGLPTLLSIFGTNQLTQHFLSAGCDKVYIWDFENQQYVSVAQKSTDHNFYYLTNWTGSACSDREVSLGSALWVQSAGSSSETNTVSMSGNVPLNDSLTNQVSGSGSRPLSFICNPFPIAQSVHNLINTNDGATAHFLAAGADRIYVWDTANQQYVTLGLKNDNQWHYATNWAGSAADITVDVGEGFWYEALNTFVWVETKDF